VASVRQHGLAGSAKRPIATVTFHGIESAEELFAYRCHQGWPACLPTCDVRGLDPQLPLNVDTGRPLSAK